MENLTKELEVFPAPNNIVRFSHRPECVNGRKLLNVRVLSRTRVIYFHILRIDKKHLYIL